MNARRSRCLAAALLVAASPGVARAQMSTEPDLAPDCVTRAVTEWSTWLRIGGGAVAAPRDHVVGVFDLGVGTDATFPLSARGTIRGGPWAQVATSTFASLEQTAGVEILFGDVPPRLVPGLFAHNEGALAARLGGGWALRDPDAGPRIDSGPVVTATLTWGLRTYVETNNSNNVYGWCTEPELFHEESSTRPVVRGHRGQGYSSGARFFVSGLAATNAPTWQLTAGIEVEPLFALRVLLRPKSLFPIPL